ncbi:MAG TPA: hypothetical protein VHV55_02780 [Pirellulales bacterium]|nr:hypothetical protein [Pirellulales bacterium]
METIGWATGAAGLCAMIVGSIWLLVVAFEEEIAWGIACLILPFVSLIFVATHWNKSAKPVYVWIAGLLAVLLGKFARDLTIY